MLHHGSLPLRNIVVNHTYMCNVIAHSSHAVIELASMY
jgi:hypothetical protein